MTSMHVLPLIAIVGLATCAAKPAPAVVHQNLISAGGFSGHDYNACLKPESVPPSVCDKTMGVQITVDKNGCVVDLECKIAAGAIKVIPAPQIEWKSNTGMVNGWAVIQ